MTHVPPVPPSERYPGRPPGGRVIVIAPTRASCETIELGVGLTGVSTLLEREHGQDVRRLAGSSRGFGVLAGTGTGKTLAIRPISEEVLGTTLRVGVVNREREATPETPTWNVVIVTTGIARRWLQDELISGDDTIIVDEIHQTSAELELCLALGKRAGCRFIWLSATVDPRHYTEYLESAEVIESSAFDPARAATVRVSSETNPLRFLGDRFLRHVARQRRGVALFVPTRAETEAAAEAVADRWPGVHTVFYHGGEPISKLTPFLSGEAPHPYLLAMTSAGQSALNIRGLDTVVIEDARFTTVVKRGRSVLTRLPLGPNEILQMAGRVHGRVEGGEVWLLSERDLDFDSLRPEAPNFQLAGDPERVALTCAAVGVRADELELPVPLDRIAYRRAVRTLEERGLVENGRLTGYGRRVEVLPVDRPWGEMLVQAGGQLLPVVATCASLESLHRMTKPERSIAAHTVKGSDHLTAYNLYAGALEECGGMGRVWELPRHVFDPEQLQGWTERRGVLVRAVEDGALALASIYRALDLPLPDALPALNHETGRCWRELVAEVMPFDLMIDGESHWGEPVRVSRTSVCGSWGAVAGPISYVADRTGRTRAFIEGTQLPRELVWKHARAGVRRISYHSGSRREPLRLRTTRDFHGFELDSREEPIDGFPAGLEEEARGALAEALAEGVAYHPQSKHNRRVLKRLRELHRRSGGVSSGTSRCAVRDLFLQKLAGVNSLSGFREADLRLELDQVLPAREREGWERLPGTIELAGREYPLDYGLEKGEPVVRARVPAGVVLAIDPRSVPETDRPLKWTVTRGKKPSLRANTLSEAKRAVSGSGPGRPGVRRGRKRRNR